MSYDLKDFRTDVLEACQTVPVVIDFWAAWCGPCRTLTPVLEKLAAQANGSWKFVKINTEEHPQIAAQFQIRSIPNVKMVYQGKLIGEFQGALPETEVKRWLDKHLPEEFKQSEQADPSTELLAAGDRLGARAALQSKVTSGKADPATLVRFALLHLPDRIDIAKEAFSALGDNASFELEKSALATVEHLKHVAQNGLGSEANIPQANTYRAAANHLFSGEAHLEDALKGFLDVLAVNRSLDDDGARKACLALFALLSEVHPLSKAYRRRFSMALY